MTDELEDEEPDYQKQVYVAYWDVLGFEAIINLTEELSKETMATLTGEEYNRTFNLNYMAMRARYNPQRSPEIWTFNVSPEVNHSDIIEMSQQTPQALVDFIRKNGKPYYTTPKVKGVIS